MIQCVNEGDIVALYHYRIVALFYSFIQNSVIHSLSLSHLSISSF